MKRVSVFFEFTFYKIYKSYINWGESDMPGIYALCLITLFQCLNVSTVIFFLISIFHVKDWPYDKGALLTFFLFCLGFNYYLIYKKKGVLSILKKWDNIENDKKRHLTKWMILYVVISIIGLSLSILY